MIPKPETPLERIERDIEWLKSLPDITRSVLRPVGILHLGPWKCLDRRTKLVLLKKLDWSGADPADYGRIMERELDYDSLFEPFSPRWIEESRLP